MIRKYKTLIILDWDDTLFPTSWITKNEIDITNTNIQHVFSKLDILISQILQKMIYPRFILIMNLLLRMTFFTVMNYLQKVCFYLI